jgi:hypothetical protein
VIWTPSEKRALCNAVEALGHQWSKIAETVFDQEKPEIGIHVRSRASIEQKWLDMLKGLNSTQALFLIFLPDNLF